MSFRENLRQFLSRLFQFDPDGPVIMSTSIFERSFTGVEMLDRLNVHDANLSKGFGPPAPISFDVHDDIALLLDAARAAFSQPVRMEPLYEEVRIPYGTGFLDLLLRDFVRILSRNLVPSDTSSNPSHDQ